MAKHLTSGRQRPPARRERPGTTHQEQRCPPKLALVAPRAPHAAREGKPNPALAQEPAKPQHRPSRRGLSSNLLIQEKDKVPAHKFSGISLSSSTPITRSAPACPPRHTADANSKHLGQWPTTFLAIWMTWVNQIATSLTQSPLFDTKSAPKPPTTPFSLTQVNENATNASSIDPKGPN